MFRPSLRLATLALAAVLAAACTSTPSPTGTAAATSQTAPTSAPQTSTPQPATAPPTAAPTAAAPTTTSGAQPTFSIPSFALPSFSADDDLAARFPTTVDGQPVTGVTTVLFMEFVLAFAPGEAEQFRTAMGSVGINADTLSFGTATATVGGDVVQLQALRTPGGTADGIIQNFLALGAVFDPGAEQPTLTQANVGGKNVTKATDADGDVAYLYATGDILWMMSDVEEAQAATMLAALP